MQLNSFRIYKCMYVGVKIYYLNKSNNPEFSKNKLQDECKEDLFDQMLD